MGGCGAEGGRGFAGRELDVWLIDIIDLKRNKI